jgi:hypothetical protein
MARMSAQDPRDIAALAGRGLRGGVVPRDISVEAEDQVGLMGSNS